MIETDESKDVNQLSFKAILKKRDLNLVSLQKIWSN